MELKKLEVPTTSITEVKKSPMDVFEQARQAGTAVYVFNREKVAGVMLTQEQYENLLQELHSRPEPVEDEIGTVDGLDEFLNVMREALITGATISAKNLDERMVALGFITRKTGFGGVVDMVTELKQTGKIIYQLRKKHDGKNVVAEVIGEQDNQGTMFDKLIIKKIHLKDIQ
ncbi:MULTISPECIES: type II toxin-antitoxin system Phd/YefM family antitoxin [Enterococcus]|uniref:Prevent-host-death protein n=1 Tax=Enterococcus diestrammenae TaxID=1155073 RepID=A0ABV0F3I3_9ENTE|nr:type II toxin-antitoxin system Phd/YefM family antitoxin [Enterococcus diestrammenae]KAF1297766.1 prevent-host-death protein [Enterococcus diestrammenae]HIX70756.1 type II toxin-antitoxin system Phd/YefM family antitoxin [Candidatus Enterococcus stercoravium]